MVLTLSYEMHRNVGGTDWGPQSVTGSTPDEHFVIQCTQGRVLENIQFSCYIGEKSHLLFS